MILGYILICGMGPMEPGAIEGCIVYTLQFGEVATCEQERDAFLDNPGLRKGHYIDDIACLVIGTSA